MPQSTVCRNLNAIWYSLIGFNSDDDVIDLMESSPSALMEYNRVLGVLEKLLDANRCEDPATRTLAAMERSGRYRQED